MAEQSPSIDVLEKDIEWSSSIGVTIPVSSVEVHQRVESITPTLLENGVLRILSVIKLFALVSTEQEQKHLFNPAKLFTNDLRIDTFVNLNSGASKDDIISIDHRVTVSSAVPRPDSIIVKGILKLKVNYVIHLVLDGAVTDFFSGAPINGAAVNVRSLENHEILASTNTGGNGMYFFNNISPGVYLVEALTDSHEPEQKVSVIKTRDIVNFVLHKRTPSGL